MRLRLGRSSTPLPPELDKPEVLAYIATLLGWQEGQPVPDPPVQLEMTVVELMKRLQDPRIRRGVVERLSPLVKQPNRAERRRRR